MIAPVPKASVLARPQPEGFTRELALFGACAMLDAVVAWNLLLRPPTLTPLQVLVAAITHVAAVLLISRVVRARPSRRWLGVASLLAIPAAGAAVAAAICVTQGRGSVRTGRRRRVRVRSPFTIAEVRRLGNTLSPCEALDSGDDERQISALTALSRRGDRDSIALLRRVSATPDSDLALLAALALDEIGERAEREVEPLELLETRYGAV